MANVRQYAYYIKGNKVSIVEKDTSLDNDTGSRDFGPGSNRAQWKSPLATVADGIEIEYTYAPIYRKFKDNVPFDNLFVASGWTVISGYVAFVSSRSSASYGVQNWSAAIAGSEGDTGGKTLDYIEVTGSTRWNGVHKVQTAGGDGNALNGGILITYTKANAKMPVLYGVDLDINGGSTGGDPYIAGDGGSTHYPGNGSFSAGDFIFISGFGSDVSNNGVFKVTTATSGATPGASRVAFDTKYYFPFDADNETFDEELTLDVHEGTGGALSTEAAADTNITLAKIEHEVIKIRTNIDVLNDEDDEVDVNRYQARAIVDFVKAKMAEDAGQIDMKEYYMKEFYKKMEKNESSKKRGIRTIVSGAHGIR
tara:strand:+ start:16405 stop:17505 length:1101 start_codon:yes stop_codon:yes gene_type:complete